MGSGSSAVRTTSPGQSSSRRTSAATPASPVFATSTTGRSPSPRPAEARRIQASNAAITASPSGNTSGWSHSAEVRTMTSGRYGSKLPAYSSASTTNSTPDPRRAVAGDPDARDGGGQERADERTRVSAGTHERVDQPAGGRALPMRPCHRDQHAACGGIGHDLLPGLERDPQGARGEELRVVRVDRGQRLGDGQPPGVWLPCHVGRLVGAGDHDPRRIQRRRVLGGSPGVASVDLGARPGGEQRRRRGARALGSHHVDALSGPDRPRRSGGLESGADLGRPAHAHARSSRTLTQVPPVPPARGASPGPPRRSRACSRCDPRTTGTAGPPPGRARRRRHTRGPPAWTRSLHPGPPPP